MTDETKCLECHGTRKVRDQFGNWDWIPCPTCALAPDLAAMANEGPDLCRAPVVCSFSGSVCLALDLIEAEKRERALREFTVRWLREAEGNGAASDYEAALTQFVDALAAADEVEAKR